jgi:DHA3 family tetracycline resistance protein-like MFS transporter
VSEPRRLAARVGILRPLGIRNFRLLWLGTIVSYAGDGIYVVAIAWQVYGQWNRPTAFAGVGVAWSLPQVIFVLLAGVLSDRFDRRKLLIAADVIRGVAIAGIGALTMAHALTLWEVYALVVVYGVGQSVYGPAHHAIVPDLVPSGSLVQANSLSQFSRPVGMTLVGPAIGGVLVGALGAGVAFMIDAGTFVFSIAMLASMRVDSAPRSTAPRETLWAETRTGLRFVFSRPWLWAGMAAATISLLCTWGPWEVLVPYLVKNELGGGATSLGIVFGAGGLGSVLAAAAMGQRDLPRRPITWLYWAWAISAFAIAGLGLARSVSQAALVSFVTESGITVLLVLWYTVVQRLVPSSLLGRVSSLDWLISVAGVPLSFAIVGPVAGAIGARETLILAGTVGGAVILLFLYLIPGSRAPEREGAALLAPSDEGAAEPSAQR